MPRVLEQSSSRDWSVCSGEMSYPATRITTMKLIGDLLGDLADVLFRGIGVLVCLLTILIIARVAF